MARPSAQRVGRGPCPDCGEAVTFRRTAAGYLTHRCDACDSNGYAEPGGAAYRTRMATITAPAAPPEPAPKASVPEAPKEPAKKIRGAFDFGVL